VATGALVPLDDFLDGEYPLDPGIYLPGVLGPGRWEGQQYLLPKDFSPLAVYYNKALFDQLGVPYPQSGWSWEQFLATAQALTRDTDGDGATDIWGVQLPAAWSTGFEYWVAAGGGSLVSPDGTSFVGHLDSPQTTAALQFYADLYQRHRVAPPPADMAAFGGGNKDFAEGRAAMQLFGRWPQVDYRANEAIELGVVGVPTGAQRANILLWGGIGISALSKNQEAAWRFLRFYAGEPGAQVWKDWALPTVKSVTAAAGFDVDPIEGVWIGELNYLSQRAYVSTPRWGDTADPAIGAMLQRAISDPQADIAALTKAAAAEAQAALEGK
jgi:multiple sugar transport system substrate-binding protein